MESQLQRPSHGHHHHYEEDPQHAGLHSVIEGEGEGGDQHQHKSVLKKVKDKAKKIKDTIKKHGHEHEHEGGHQRENIDQEGYVEEEEEDDDEDEEMVNDPEVHGAPIYESTVIRSTNLPRETSINVEKPEGTNKHEQHIRDEGIERPVAPGPMAHEFERPPTMAAHEPVDKNALNVEKPKIKLRPGIGLEEDPHPPYSSPAEIPHYGIGENENQVLGRELGTDRDRRSENLDD